MFRIISSHKILHDAATFEDPNLIAIVQLIGDRRNAPIRVDLAEPTGFLLVDTHVKFADGVREAELLQRDRHFDSIRCLASI